MLRLGVMGVAANRGRLGGGHGSLFGCGLPFDGNMDNPPAETREQDTRRTGSVSRLPACAAPTQWGSLVRFWLAAALGGIQVRAVIYPIHASAPATTKAIQLAQTGIIVPPTVTGQPASAEQVAGPL